jgi:hypothetical protein
LKLKEFGETKEKSDGIYYGCAAGADDRWGAVDGGPD